MIIVGAKRHFRERAIEWWSAGMMAVWGAYVILHPGMFESIGILHGMLIIAPQHVWGFVSLMAGIVRLSALTINGFWYRTPLIRLVTSFVAVFIWFWIAVGMFLSEQAQMGIVVYAGHMVADMYSAFRSASDTYEAEARRRVDKMTTPDYRDAPNVSKLHGR